MSLNPVTRNPAVHGGSIKVVSDALLAMPRNCSECCEKSTGGWCRWAAMGVCPVVRPDLKMRMIANNRSSVPPAAAGGG